MNGKPAERTQVDGLQDSYSAAAGLDFADAKDTARQEFKQEADINYILSRFNVGADTLVKRATAFGEADYTIDLQSALAAVSEAKSAYARMPEHIKTRYAGWRELLDAADNGDLKTLKEAANESTDNNAETKT